MQSGVMEEWFGGQSAGFPIPESCVRNLVTNSTFHLSRLIKWVSSTPKDLV